MQAMRSAEGLPPVHPTLGYAPEGVVHLTTVTTDSDYLAEHLFWQDLDQTCCRARR